MISYEILGKVTARREGQAVAIPPQQQLLLSRLIWARRKSVPSLELERAVWDKGRIPAGGLKSAVHELRRSLAAEEILACDGNAYRLDLDGQQVDAFRFAARAGQAGQAPGEEMPRLAREALTEWGPVASGLFGGQPLLGLDGSWARDVRRGLRLQYRNVIFGLLRRDAEAGDWESVLSQCDLLAFEDRGSHVGNDPQTAMTDMGFLEVWMRAALRTGQPDLAEWVAKEATGSAARAGQPASDDLARMLRRLRDEGPQAAAPGGRTAPMRPTSPADGRRPANEPSISFNNNSGSVVNGQIGIVQGGVTFGLPPGSNETGRPASSASGSQRTGAPDE